MRCKSFSIAEPFVPCVLQGGLQLQMGVMQARADGTFGGVEFARDFSVRHSLEVEHGHDAAVSVGKFFECLVEACAKFADDGLAFRIGAMAGINERGIAAIVGNDFVEVDA